MLVLLDFAWVSTAETPVYPAQISAIRVDEAWSPADRFDSLIKPSEPSDKTLSKGVYKGFPPADFLNADSPFEVFSALYDWFSMDDILCWWDAETVSAFKQATHCLLRRVVGHDMKVLEPLFTRTRNQSSGSDHLSATARSHGVAVPEGMSTPMRNTGLLQSLLIGTHTARKSVLSLKSCFDTTDELQEALSDEEPAYAKLYPNLILSSPFRKSSRTALMNPSAPSIPYAGGTDTGVALRIRSIILRLPWENGKSP